MNDADVVDDAAACGWLEPTSEADVLGEPGCTGVDMPTQRSLGSRANAVESLRAEKCLNQVNSDGIRMTGTRPPVAG